MASRASAASPLLIVPGLTILALISIYLAGAETQLARGKGAEDTVQALGIAFAVLGFIGRFIFSGDLANRPTPTAVSKRRAMANLAIIFGLTLCTQVWWLVLVGTTGYVFWLFRHMTEHLREFEISRDPVIQPARTYSFSWAAALRTEYATGYLILACIVLFEIAVDLRTGYATTTSWPSDWQVYFSMLAGATFLAPIVRFATRPASSTPQSWPATRGLRVDGRANMVDLLENLISGGRQEAILSATLDASGVSEGDHLIDVGCGTGKLAIAAAERVGAHGKVIGIDATPAMVDLAIERGHNAKSNATFKVGVAESLPLPDSSQQAVTSSYFFHHLPSDLKREVLGEMLRVLAPGGRLIITDYGRPSSMLGQIASIPMRFDFHEYVRPQLAGELEDIVAETECGEPELVASFLGYINVLRIVKPGVSSLADAST